MLTNNNMYSVAHFNNKQYYLAISTADGDGSQTWWLQNGHQ